MSYLSELRAHWRPIFAATFGIATGISQTSYVNSIAAPHMIRELGWTNSQFALVGSLSLITAFALPFIGRLADVLGVRRTVIIGMISLPLVFLGFGMLSGPISQYIILYFVQGTVCVTTSATVYSRVAVQYAEKARGLALAIVVSGGAVASAIGSPILNNYVESYGWRAGYQAMAIFTIAASAITLMLLPRERDAPRGTVSPSKRRASKDYPAIFRNPIFWVLLTAMLLCNLPQIIAVSQLMVVLLDNGIGARQASVMLSAFAIGTLGGRFVAGVALDRLPPHLIAMGTMALPAAGLLLIASSLDSPEVLTFAVLCFGFSIGAEGDIVGFLVARTFGVEVYSSVMGLMTMAISLSSAVGAAFLSLSLKLTGSFDPFLIGASVAVLAGSFLFLLMPKVASKTTDHVAS